MSLNHITQSALKDQSLPGRLETLKNLEEANLLTQVKEWGVFIFFEFKGEPLNWMKCKNCKEFLNAARGGHRTRHSKNRCTATKTKPTEEPDFTDVYLKYCLKSGKSFEQVASKEFQELIRDILEKVHPTWDVESLQLPTKEELEAALLLRTGGQLLSE